MKPNAQTDGRSLNGPRQRGQLVLISAILIAFIILGLVVVFNGLLYTETVATGDASEGMDDVQKTEIEIRQGLEEQLTNIGEGPIGNCKENADPARVTCLRELTGTVNSGYSDAKATERPVNITVTVVNAPMGNVSSDATIGFEYTYESGQISAKRTLDIEVGN